MRSSTRFFAFLVLAYALVGGALLHARAASRARAAEIEAVAAFARRLSLTDLCLFIEARYTRHPTQADLFTPFQEHPSSLEHFPSGSLIAPPARD